MIQKLELYTTNIQGRVTGFFTDFKIGKIKLANHLDTKDEIGVLDVAPTFAKQLLLKEDSGLKSKRVPLYVCRCCADLGCGATTAKIERTEKSFIWSDFRRENNYEESSHQTEFMKRTGPFEFDAENYISAIQPYTKKN